jgi:outer membrane protein, heavy metal efflux system
MRVMLSLLLAGLFLHARNVPEPAIPPRLAPALTLEEVLVSVERQYPPLLAALQDRVIAGADVTIAEGRFDLNLKAGYEGGYLDYYRNDIYRAGVEQATPFQGLSYSTGYSLGQGPFPSYEGDLKTYSQGEYKAEMRAPVLRGRAIDSSRAELQKALIGRRIADLNVEQQRLLVVQMATRRYYDWIAAGQRLDAAKAMLAAAEEREKQLLEAARLGQIPQIDATDNRRAIFSRRAFVVEAERGLQLAAIELSLYLRDSSGQPVLPAAEQLPQAFPQTRKPDEQRLNEDIELALRRRPEVQRFAAQRDQVGIDRKLASNQLLPKTDLVLSYKRELGERTMVAGPDQLNAAIVFDLPVQQRVAKGKDLSAAAKVEQLNQRVRFARDTVTAEVRDAYSALDAAYKRASLLREEVEVSQQLVVAERVRFELGEGTLFLVNLREQAAFDAVLREVAAVNEYFRARALYDFAIAEATSSRSSVSR